MFKKILVATDGSEHARKAVDLASDMAVKYNAELLLLHVTTNAHLSEEMLHMLEVEHLVDADRGAEPLSARYPVAPTPSATRSRESGDLLHKAHEGAGRMILEVARRSAKKTGVASIRAALDQGDAAERILHLAESEEFDVIVLGSRGVSELKGLLLGSVSHKVNQLAKCTCITVK